MPSPHFDSRNPISVAGNAFQAFLGVEQSARDHLATEEEIDAFAGLVREYVEMRDDPLISRIAALSFLEARLDKLWVLNTSMSRRYQGASRPLGQLEFEIAFITAARPYALRSVLSETYLLAPRMNESLPGPEREFVQKSRLDDLKRSDSDAGDAHAAVSVDAGEQGKEVAKRKRHYYDICLAVLKWHRGRKTKNARQVQSWAEIARQAHKQLVGITTPANDADTGKYVQRVLKDLGDEPTPEEACLLLEKHEEEIIALRACALP